jgi:hypothetical protein
MFPTTVGRVPRHTPDCFNETIRQQIRENVAIHAYLGPRAIGLRLRELDREWDIERLLEANAATLALVGLGLGAFLDRRFLLLPTAVATFLLQHALQGWCPPVPLLRALGVRTAAEIDEERSALKALRVDFEDEPASPGRFQEANGVERALTAAAR